MRTFLIRTGSGLVPLHSPFISGSPRVSISLRDSVSCIFSGKKTSPRICLHSNVNRRNRRPIRRSLSEYDMNLENEIAGGLRGWASVRSQLFTAQMPEEEYVSDSDDVVLGDIGIGSGLSNYSREWPGSEIPVELEFSGDGSGKGSISGCGSGGNSDRRKMGAYYEEMLKTDPTNSLLLTNYGKFLHEVEGDTVKAEEYYGRAILATPGDGEMLSMYGKLIWEMHRDKDRAESYFDRAVDAAPDNCMVLGSYAQFMWAIDTDEDEEVVVERESGAIMSPTAVIEAF